MIDWLVYQRGMWRIRFGFCPICNSDAPELDTCKFCDGFRGYRDKTARRELEWKWLKHTNREWMRYWV